MLNHARTLLLNLKYDSDGEHIPKNFSPITLPKELQDIYNILFPKSSSRYYKLFLAQNYLSIIKAAGLDKDLEKFDARISYDLQDNEYFKINRISNPEITSFRFPIFVIGNYNNVIGNPYFYDQFVIRQIGTTNKVTVYSAVNHLYHNEERSFNYYDPAQADITLDAALYTRISNTGIKFLISGDSFGEVANKKWSFIVEAPYKFDFGMIYNSLNTSTSPDELFKFNPNVDVTNYRNLWNTHYNTIYQMAGLLLAYIEKVNAII